MSEETSVEVRLEEYKNVIFRLALDLVKLESDIAFLTEKLLPRSIENMKDKISAREAALYKFLNTTNIPKNEIEQIAREIANTDV